MAANMENSRCPADPRTEPCLLQLRDLIYKVAGIYKIDEHLPVLEKHCLRRMEAVGVGSLNEYFEMLTLGASRTSEMHSLLDELVTGETSFFREWAQLEALQQQVLPVIARSKEKLSMRSIRAWSAGCSTGEEPYTLAMLLMEHADGLLSGFNIELLATDASDRALDRAQRGVYGDVCTREMTPYFREKYGTMKDDEWHISDAVREKVTFKHVNLLDDSRMELVRGMDLIFCRNVLIYLEGESKKRVMRHFRNSLSPDSYLFLANSESLFGLSEDFRLVHLPGTMAYLKMEQRSAGAK